MKYLTPPLQFLLLVQRESLPRAYLDRRVTILVPTNEAMAKFRGPRGEALALNHFINSIVVEAEVGDKLGSLATGSPPVWVTKRSGWLYFSQVGTHLEYMGSMLVLRFPDSLWMCVLCW